MRAKFHLDALLVYVEAEPYTWLFSRRMQLGLYYVAQYAVDAGYQVRVENLSANDYVVRRLSRLLDKYSCHILGLYVDQDNLWSLRRILPTLKKHQPLLNIIVGGPQVTADPELTLERLSEATCGVIGEGEESFVELLSLQSLTPELLNSCNGLVIRTIEGVIKTSPRQPIDNLDRLSIPNRKELTLSNKDLIVPVMMSGRGCSGRCAFCYEGGQNRSGRRLRLHSTKRCIEEFDYLKRELKRGSEYICILDDTFVADTKRLREFCKELIKRYNGKIKWFCEARVDTLAKHPDLLPLMIEAGLIRIQVGGESGCQQILDTYQKGTTLEQISYVVEQAKIHGLLSIYANFIVGGAYETQESFKLTLDFALKLLRLAPGRLSVGCSFFTPYPGTPMYQNPEAFGIKIIDKEVVTGMGDKHVFCRTDQLSRFEILEMGNEFKNCVQKTMIELSTQLPFEIIEGNFRAHFEYGLSTEWFEFLSENIALYGYYKSIFCSNDKRFEEIAAKDFHNAYPIRNIDLVASKKEKYIIRLPMGSIRELNKLESIILELSAGKLCFDEIVEIVNNLTPELSRTEVHKTIIEKYADFDKEFLITWKTNIL